MLGVQPTRSIAIEDSATGTQAARAAGMFIIGVPSHPELVLDSDLYAPALDDPQVREALGIATSVISKTPDRFCA